MEERRSGGEPPHLPADVDPTQEQLFPLEDSFLEANPNAISAGTLPGRPGPRVTPLHIRRLWCQNLKAFEDVELQLDAFSVLVGTNSSGKSTLLQAIALAHRLLSVHASEGESEVKFPASEGRLLLPEILPVAVPRDLWYRRRQRIGRSEHVRVVVGVEYENGWRFEFAIRGLFGSLNSRLTESPGTISTADYQRIVRRPPVIVPAAVGIVAQEEYRTPARRAGLLASGRQNEIIRNHLHALLQSESDSFQAISDVLEVHFGARVRDVLFAEDQDQFLEAIYSEEDGSVEHDLFSAGGGFLQVLQLLTFAFSYDAGLLGLDEPDAHLHSSLQQIVVRILETLNAERGTQIVLATHSKEIINFVDSARLIPVRKGVTPLVPLRPYQSAIEVLQDVGAVDNVDAYSLLLSKRCTFVEGKSDQRLLKRFATKLGSTVFEGDSKVVVIPTRGVSETRHLQQLDVFEQMIGDGIASLQIIDRDGLPDRLLQEVADGPERPLHVLGRDSIENYLLASAPLLRVVQAELARRDNQTAVTLDEIEAILEESADALRQESVDRSTNSIEQYYVTRRQPNRPTAAQMATEAREHVASNFASLDRKLSVVEGRALLARVREVLQTRHQISFGSDRLAEEFREDEIPEEVKEIIEKLGGLGST